MDKNLKRLFKTKYPYSDTKQDRARFLVATRETCRDFIKRSPEYRKICRQYGFSPKNLKSMIFSGTSFSF